VLNKIIKIRSQR